MLLPTLTHLSTPKTFVNLSRFEFTLTYGTYRVIYLLSAIVPYLFINTPSVTERYNYNLYMFRLKQKQSYI